MPKVIQCPNCGADIKASFVRGAVHIECKKCTMKYEMSQRSMKRHMVVPMIAVAISVGLSLLIFPRDNIDIKFIFIIGLSFILALLIDKIFITLGLITYEKKN